MSKFKGQKILVTGGTGFIGGRLVEELILKYEADVRVLVRNFGHAARIARFPIEMVAGDLNDQEALNQAVQGCEIVFHCAYGSSGSVHEQHATTVEGTRNIARAAAKARVKKMVHMSTFSVYGNAASGILDEDTPHDKTDNFYSNMKQEAEELVIDYYKEKGLPITVIQPTIVYGPYSPQWVVGPIHELKTGKVVLANGGMGSCNVVYVDDVVNAMILAAECDQSNGECFLISGKETITWHDFYQAYQHILEVDSLINMSPAEIQLKSKPTLMNRLRQLLRFMRSRSRLINTLAGSAIVRQPYRWLRECLNNVKVKATKHPKSIPEELYLPDEALIHMQLNKTSVSINKAEKVLGFSPHYDFTNGMKMTAKWMRWANLV